MALREPGPACLLLAKDIRLAGAVAAGLRSRLAEVPVLVPPMSGDDLSVPWAAQRLRAWWDGQRTGSALSAATLLIVDAEELAGVGRVAYVAVPPGQVGARTYAPGSAVIEVAATTVGDLVEAVVTGTPGAAIVALPRSRWRARRVWDRRVVRTAVLTGILGIGGWLLSAVLPPAQVQAATVHHGAKDGGPALEQSIRDQVNEHLRMRHLPRSARDAVREAGRTAPGPDAVHGAGKASRAAGHVRDPARTARTGVDGHAAATALDRARRAVEDLTGKDSPEARRLRRAARIAEHVSNGAHRATGSPAGESGQADRDAHHGHASPPVDRLSHHGEHDGHGPGRGEPGHGGDRLRHAERGLGHAGDRFGHGGHGLGPGGDRLGHAERGPARDGGREPDAGFPGRVALPDDLAPSGRAHPRKERDAHRERQDRRDRSAVRHVVDEVPDPAVAAPPAGPPRNARLLPAPVRESTPIAEPPREIHHAEPDPAGDVASRVTHRGDAGASNAPVLPPVPPAPLPPAPVPSAGKAETVVVPVPPVGGSPQPTYGLPEVVHEAVAPEVSPSGPPLAVRLATG